MATTKMRRKKLSKISNIERSVKNNIKVRNIGFNNLTLIRFSCN